MFKITLTFLILIFSHFSQAFEYTLELSESQLQEKISVLMPVTKKTMLATVVINDAHLSLVEGTGKISISASIQANALAGLMANGKLKIQGSLEYRAKEAAFYFYNPEIIELNIEQIPAQFHAQVKKLAQQAVSKALSRNPIYKLKEDNIKHNLAKSMLKKIEVKHQILVITLGLF